MRFDHTLCLRLCWVPADTRQNVVECPSSFNESSVDQSETGIHVPGLSPPVCPGCLVLNDALHFCQHCSQAVCPACNSLHRKKVLAHLTEKFTALRSERTALASFEAALSNFKSDMGSCKERLHCQVTLATLQLQCLVHCSLETSKQTLVLIYADEEARLKKLGEEPRKLDSMRIAHRQVADDVRQGKMSIELYGLGKPTKIHRRKQRRLEEAFELHKISGIAALQIAHDLEAMSVVLEITRQSARNLLRRMKKLDKLLEDSQPSRISTLRIAQKFETIQLHLQDFRLLVPDSEDCQYTQQSGPSSRYDESTLAPLQCDFDRTNYIGLETKELDNDTFFFTSNKPTLSVGQLNLSTTSADLKAYFSEFGTIASAEVITDETTHKSRGCGLVTFTDWKALEGDVLEANHFLDGCRLLVKSAITCDGLRAYTDRPPVQCENSLKGNLNPKRIRVSDLPATTEDCDLFEYFSRFGLLTQALVRKRPKGRNSARNGLVVFRDTDSAKNMFDAQPHILNGTKISVSMAKKKKSDYEDRSSHIKLDISYEENYATSSNRTTIYVSGLTSMTTATDLEVYFSKFDTVTKARVVTDRTTGLSRGFGFVTFVDRKVLESGVLETCHFINGSRLKVELQRTCTQSRPARNLNTEDIQGSTNCI